MQNRMFAALAMKALDQERRTFTGIASTVSADRMGDVVEPSGLQFKLPLPLLHQHQSDRPIGYVTAAKVTKTGVEIEGRIENIPDAPQSLRERLDVAWAEIKSGLVRGLSIGFNPLEYVSTKDGGLHFKRAEWLELSTVTIPANAEASILSIKSMGRKSLAASGKIATSSPFISPGVSGNFRGTTMKTLREQLLELKEARAQKAQRMGEIQKLKQAEVRPYTADESVELDDLRAEVTSLDDQIRDKEIECVLADNARSVIERSRPYDADSVKMPHIHVKKEKDAEDRFEGQSFVRQIIARACAQLNQTTPSAIAEHRWGKSNPTLVRLIKANEVAAGGAASGEWGAELVDVDNRFRGDFVNFLYGRTVYDQLPLRRIPAYVSVKGQDGQATGYWVGEGAAIPMTEMDFSNVELTPLEVGALAAVSNKMLRHNSHDAEMYVRDALVEASSQRIDTTFLSTSAAVSGVSPAGLLNGVTGTAASGTDAAAVRTDIEVLYAPFIAAKNASNIHLVTTPGLAKAISLMRSDLEMKVFPDVTGRGGRLEDDPLVVGDNVTSGHLIAIKPDDVWRIGDGGVRVELSREATLEMSSAPTGNAFTPAAQSQQSVSMFQNEMTAIKVVREINFAKRRSHAVQYITGAGYGGVAS